MIELQGVHRRYAMSGQTVHALAGVDLHIGAGEFVTLTGPAGSGKASLLNILGCLDHPSEGRYLIEGQDVAHLDDEASSDLRNRRIGFVFQSFHLLPRLTVLENVLLPLRIIGYDQAQAEKRARVAIEKVGLAGREGADPVTLSGGEQQRLCIARAVVHQPSLLIADEPSANLDRAYALDIMELFKTFHEAGTTVIVAAHDETLMADYGHRILRLQEGRFAA